MTALNARPTLPLMLEAKGLGKKFGAVVAAANINLQIAAGERVSLIGSNGAGKTTFVNMITGYLKPDVGHILFDGHDITPLDPRAITQRGVARSFQIPQALAISMLSSTLRSPYSCGIWNERATPRWVMALGCSGVMSWPSTRMWPTSGLR